MYGADLAGAAARRGAHAISSYVGSIYLVSGVVGQILARESRFMTALDGPAKAVWVWIAIVRFSYLLGTIIPSCARPLIKKETLRSAEPRFGALIFGLSSGFAALAVPAAFTVATTAGLRMLYFTGLFFSFIALCAIPRETNAL